MTLTLSRMITGRGGRGQDCRRGRAVAVVAAVSCAAGRIRWGKVELVPGLAALNKGVSSTAPTASVNAISCWGAGGCVVGGFYTDGHKHVQAFVARERKGRWAKAVEVPGTAALNKGGNAQVGQVSCARTSVCVAVGTYTDKAGNGQWFTVTERNGRWGTAAPVPDPALNQATTSTVWCAVGVCAAGGSFTDPTTGPEAWVRTQTHGRWQAALEVPGLAALQVNGSPHGESVGVNTVSCASAGNCAAGGQYNTSATLNPTPSEPFVVAETDGSWGMAEEVPGIGAINQGQAGTNLMTCPSAGNCTAGGNYAPENPNFCDVTNCNAPFVVNQRHGTWAGATSMANAGFVQGLTCPATGDCVAAGTSINNLGNGDGELLSETNDRWARALIRDSLQEVSSVSCASPGYCAAGGENLAGNAFVISEWHGVWGKAITPAGIPARYYASVTTVACPPKITLCIAGGIENAANGSRAQPFIVSQTR